MTLLRKTKFMAGRVLFNVRHLILRLVGVDAIPKTASKLTCNTYRKYCNAIKLEKINRRASAK